MGDEPLLWSCRATEHPITAQESSVTDWTQSRCPYLLACLVTR